jgi:hypothetical protein
MAIQVGRAINGIGLNGLEWLLAEDTAIRVFKNIEEAKEFLREHDFPDATDEEIEDYYTFKDTDTLATVVYENMVLKDHNDDGSWWHCIDCEVEFSLSREELIKAGVELPPLK